MMSKENGYTVYKVYPDGSGETIAWFQYPGICAKFVNGLRITDFISPVTPDDTITILTIDDCSREIRGDLTVHLIAEDV